jgi:hypothetical protein
MLANAILAWVSLYSLAYIQLVFSLIQYPSIIPTNGVYLAGYTGLFDIALTTTDAIPVGGKVTLQFPTGFGVASTEMTSRVGIDLSSTISYSGRTIAVTVAGTDVPAATSLSFTVNGITSPGKQKFQHQYVI